MTDHRSTNGNGSEWAFYGSMAYRSWPLVGLIALVGTTKELPKEFAWIYPVVGLAGLALLVVSIRMWIPRKGR